MSTTASALSFPEAEPERGSHLDRGVRIQGKIFSDQDLHVDGEVEGTLEISGHNLTVGAKARVKAFRRIGKHDIRYGRDFVDRIRPGHLRRWRR